MPPIQKNIAVLDEQAKFGDSLETILMAPLQSVLCARTTQPKGTPTKHHWNGGSITSLLAKLVFPVPAASSKSEQVSSVAGNVVTPKRAKLNPEKVEDLVVVNCNLRLLKTMGSRK